MESMCQLCLIIKPLRRSHILPEFMYQNIYDDVPRTFAVLTVNTEDLKKSTRKIEQKGKREYLFCDGCEVLLSKYEKYAAESIFGKDNISKHFIQEEIIPGFNNIFYHYRGFDYVKLKKFLLSILWRLLISKTFITPIIEDSIYETLRKSILNDIVIPWDSYGCVIYILTSNGRKLGKFMHGPYETFNYYTTIVNIIVDGLLFCFYLCEGKKIRDEISLFFLQNDGRMILIDKDIQSDPFLIEKLNAAFKFYHTKE